MRNRKNHTKSTLDLLNQEEYKNKSIGKRKEMQN
jgi:hypothetical protein